MELKWVEVVSLSEPMDEHPYKSNYIDDNTPFADFNKFNEFSGDMLSPKVELTVKDETYGKTSSSNISSSFARRKAQQQQTTDRSAESLPICQRCKEVFFKKQSYLRHVAESSCGIQEYDFKCNICPMSFMTTEELQRHKQLHRADKFFCHKYCGKHFDTIAECESHEYMQHEYERFVCNMCSGTFATREQLYAHLPQHKFQQRYDCPICRLWYQTAVELHEHRLSAPYFCGKYYTNQQQQLATNQGNYKLQDCHMATMEIPTAPLHKATPSNASALPATAALSSLLQQRQANADGTAAMFAAASSSSASLKSEVSVKLERSYSNSTSESSYSHQDNSSYNNAYGSDSSIHGGALAGPQAHSSTLDDSEDALCCVPLCGVRKSTSPTLQFFTFPKDEKYLNQWLHNLKMFHIPAASYATFRICSMHFPKRCINRYSLCYWAVPTFNLGHDDVANLYQNRELTNTFTTGEVARCSMPHCTSQRGESNLKFYNFPKDIKSLIKWCQNARLPVQAKEPRHFCSRHFEDRCIGKFRLKPWAVPTLHLGAQYGKIHDNPKNLYVEEKRCCLNFCRRSRSSDFNMSLYRFPRDEVLLRRWCYNLRLDPGVYRGKNHKICSAHFIKEALGLRKLSPGAVPTLHLGHNDTFNIYENELWPPPSPTGQHGGSHQLLQQQQTSQQLSHHHSSLQNQHQPMHSKSYQRHSAASTSSSASSASHYVDPEMSASYLNLSAGGSSGGMNASDCMDVCCVPSCESKRHNSENITFHTIPRRPEQMRKWCHNLKIPEDKMHKGMRICSLHFEPYCIGGCMRPFAVPTLHLGHEDEDIHRNPDVIKKLNIRETCCVAVCKRNRDRDHANLHRFPSNVALLTKWCANLQRTVPDGSKLFNDAICEVHFEDRCLRNKRLEKWAVPTLILGHEDIAYQLPTPEQVAEFYARPTAPNNGEEQGECCVETCKRNPSVDDIKLYRPPEDTSVLAKWAHNLQTEAAVLTNMRICNLHFEAHCIGKRMRPWAIPTLNLAGNIENLYENPEHSMLYKRRTHIKQKVPVTKPTWVPRCCLPHCRKVRALHNVQLYRFPKLNRSTLAKWAHNLQVPQVGSAQRRVCSAHFEPHVLSKKCPVPLAVPTLDLNSPAGHKIYQNPAKLKANKLCLQRVCIVESCRKTRAQGVQLFRLPHSPTQLRKWMHNIRTRPRAAMRSQYRVCSRHFETHSFNGRRLSAGAIPTLELGHDDDDIFPNEAQAFADEHCAVEGCESSKEQPEVRLFRFPTDDDDMLWKWCNNLKMNPVDCIGVRICNKHFDADCIGPKHLYKWAIPTMLLGHDDSQIELILNPKPEERYVDPVFKCIVPTCGKTRRFDEVQMNSFPKDADLFQRWRHNLRLEHLCFKEREKYKICNAHFEDMCIGKTRLNIGSIPTLELGHEETEDLFKVNPEDLQSNLFGRPRRLLRGMNNVTIKQELPETEEQDIKPDIRTNFTQVKIKKSLGDIKCCVHTCGRSRLEHGARLFPFPTGKQQHLKWRHNLRLEPDEVDKTTRVCSAHFNRRCIDGKHLRGWAMPTQQLGHQEQPIYENPKNIPGFFTPTCALGHCRKRRSIDNDLRTYRYPRSEDLLEKWRANLGLSLDQCRGRICADHFEPQVRGKLKLKTGAVPTLKLGHEEALMYDNEAIKAGVAEEEVCSPPASPLVTPKTEVLDEEEREDDEEEEENPEEEQQENHDEEKDEHEDDTPEGAEQLGDEDDDEDPGNYFDPLELVETYAEHPSDDDNSHEEADDAREEDEEEEEEAETLLPDTPPNIAAAAVLRVPKPWERPLAVVPRREKRPNNVDPICCLKHCRKERSAMYLLSTFGFPKDQQLLLKWCANLQMDPSSCIGRVCIEHFQSEVLGTRKLKQNAVPTLNVGHDVPLRYSCNGQERRQAAAAAATSSFPDEMPQHSVFRLWSLKHCRKRKVSESPAPAPAAIKKEEQMQMEMEVETKPKICCLSSCGNVEGYGPGGHFQPLPQEQRMLKKWQHNLKLPSVNPDSDLRDFRLCMEHFEPHQIENGAPVKMAVPTLKLGHSSPNIFKNRESTLPGCLWPSCPPNRKICYDLPDNEAVRAAWLSYVRLPPDSQGRLCGLHFLQLYEEVDLPGDVPETVLERLQGIYDQASISLKFQCSVQGCGSKYKQDTHLAKLPRDAELLAKWLHNTRITYDRSLHFSYRICLLHFEAFCLNGVRPQTWAIPTLQLNHDGEIYQNTVKQEIPEMPLKQEILENPVKQEKSHCGSISSLSLSIPLHIKTEQGPVLRPRGTWGTSSQSSPCLSASSSPRLKNRICCVSECGEYARSQRLYRFPTAEPALLKWLVNTQQKPGLVDIQNLFVCQLHFEADAINQTQLRSWAVPTLRLGHDGHVIPNARHNGNIANSQETEQAMEFIRANYCAVLSCFQPKGDGVRFYKYPSDIAMARRWATNLKHRSMQASSHGFLVCQSHFAADCFDPETGDLREDAVPVATLAGNVKTEGLLLRCLVRGCSTDNSEKGLLFKVPKKNRVRDVWAHNLWMHPIELMGEHYICDRHFEAHCVNEHKLLHAGSVPTLHLGHSEPLELLPNPQTFQDCPEECECCVPGCGRTNRKEEDLQFSKFPKWRVLYEKWLHNFRLEVPKEQRIGTLRVCHMHFEESCHDGQNVRRGAMPTLELGHSHPDIYRSDKGSLWKKVHKRFTDCCYPDCYEECHKANTNRMTYDLPSDGPLRESWQQHMAIPASGEDGSSVLKLCALHYIMLYEHSEQSFPEHGPNLLLDKNYEHARQLAYLRRFLCAVQGCRHLQPRDGGPMHGIPRRREILRMWVENAKLKLNEHEIYMTKLCSKHFEAHCLFEGKKCYPWSVPTLHLPEVQPGQVLHQNPTKEEWQEMKQRMKVEEQTPKTEDQADGLLMEPYVKMEPHDDESQTESELLINESTLDSQELSQDFPTQEPMEMPALEVLLEVGHIEKLDSYEKKEYSADTSTNTYAPNKRFRHQYSAHKCSVEGCRVSLEDLDGNLKLHKLPSSTEAAGKWLYNIQVEIEDKWRIRVCSHHFDRQCLNGSRLRRGSMPTLLLGPRVPEAIHQNEFAQLQLDDAPAQNGHTLERSIGKVVQICVPSPSPPRKSSKFCQIEGCPNHLTSENMTLHKFPHSSWICTKWQHNTQVPFDPEYRWRYRICSAHFHPVCMVNMRLLHGSVPTLKLGPRAPGELFDSDFEAINIKIEKMEKMERKSEAQRSTTGDRYPTMQAMGKKKFKTEELEDGMEEEDDMLCLEPEMQLYEDQEEQQQKPKINLGVPNGGWKTELRLPSKGRVAFNPVRSGYDKCSLMHCQRQRSKHGVHIYKFPRSEEHQQRWMHNLRIRYDEKRPWKFMVCSVHFEPHCIRLRKLRPWAVPTLELGDNVPEDIYTNEQCQMFASGQGGEINGIDSDEAEAEPEAEGESDGNDEDGLLEDEDEETDDQEPIAKKRRRSRLDAVWPPGQAPPWKVKQCCLPYCRSPRGEGIKLFRLPNKVNSIRNWEMATGMKFKESQRNTRLICSRHFEPELIGVRRLMRNAIPTRHLGPTGDVKPVMAPPTAGPKCCMADCTYDVADLKLHKFPSNPKLLRKWCQALRVTDMQRYRGKHICSAHLPVHEAVQCIVCGADKAPLLPMLNFPANRNQRAKWCYNLKIETIPKWDISKHICCKHFEPYCFAEAGFLKPEAAPTLHLNHNDTNIFLNDCAINPAYSVRVKDEPMDNQVLSLV
ncbi:uncharacterized protein LOC108162515 isoform X2 [Drosophila miranda]|uniref:uncharacterized protein LOC108162515 isoform X2 n=1 Tax=Drosophila miranda TaxID=7229 RepID=UPI00143F8DF2|nr:uncharacterized protein LOC108162515 isoform X2 [Drosophila miranda]